MTAQDLYEQWVAYPGLEDSLRDDLDAIQNDEKAIYDRFYQDLEFGTGGLRGILGAGTNRMNVYTVRRASRGLAEYLLTHVDDAATRGIAVGYDCRRMSKEFALEVGLVMTAAGIRAHVFEHLCPTPELSYAVRSLGAAGGVMITASHNPPEYNGYKVYGPDGGQVLPDAAEKITALIEGVQNIFEVPRDDEAAARKRGMLCFVGGSLDEAYEREVLGQVMVQGIGAEDRAALKVVYTPLHGTGNVPIQQVLTKAGYTQATVVPSQSEPDGEFPTVKSPNPEEPEALHMAIKLAERIGAELVMGTDPDADRVGIAARQADGTYRLFTGNQTGGLMLDFLLRQMQAEGSLPSNGIVFKTIVTSELGAALARRHGVSVEDTLTGFKYIGDRIGHYERTGRGVFLFGYEESYGYLLKPFVRDKDAVQSCLFIAEMAAWYKRQGKTLSEGLEDIFREVGWFEERLISITMPGADGVRKIEAAMEGLRSEPLKVAGLHLKAVEDYDVRQKRVYDVAGDLSNYRVEHLELPQSDVIRYLFEGGSWLAVRPSGTEPKMKIYLGARGQSQAECDALIRAMDEAVNRLR